MSENTHFQSLEITALILAGGFGTRLQHVVNQVPKILAPVADHPYVEYLITYLTKQGIKDIVFCTGYQADQVEEYCGDGSRWGIEVRYSREHEPLGTGGAIKNAEDMIRSDPFLVLNGDSLANFNISKLLHVHKETGARITLVLTSVTNQDRYGSVILGKDDLVLGFLEKGEKGAGVINAGIYMLNQVILIDFPEGKVSLEKEFFPRFVKQSIYGLTVPGPFIDIGTPNDYAKAQSFLSTWMGEPLE